MDVYGVNTNIKYFPKPRLITLMSGIDSGHC